MTEFNLGAALQDYKENSEITILDDGVYTLEVISASSGTSKNGNPKITPVFKVALGPYAGKRVMAGQITYTEAAAHFFFGTLKGFGITQDQLQLFNSQPDPIKLIADALVGRVVDATLTTDEWGGEPRNKLSAVQLASGVTPTPVPDTQSQPQPQPQVQVVTEIPEGAIVSTPQPPPAQAAPPQGPPPPAHNPTF